MYIVLYSDIDEAPVPVGDESRFQPGLMLITTFSNGIDVVGDDVVGVDVVGDVVVDVVLVVAGRTSTETTRCRRERREKRGCTP